MAKRGFLSDLHGFLLFNPRISAVPPGRSPFHALNPPCSYEVPEDPPVRSNSYGLGPTFSTRARLVVAVFLDLAASACMRFSHRTSFARVRFIDRPKASTCRRSSAIWFFISESCLGFILAPVQDSISNLCTIVVYLCPRVKRVSSAISLNPLSG